MKIRLLAGASVLCLLTTQVLAQRVKIDYDTEFDFSKIETYAWVEPEESEDNALLHQRIVNAIDYHLSMNGGKKVESDPDVYVTYHSDSKDHVRVDSTHFGYGYGGGWYWSGGMGGMGGTTETISTYEEGTLIVDVWDSKSKNLVWRGTATAAVKREPEKLEKQLNKAMDRLFSKWKKMVAKGL